MKFDREYYYKRKNEGVLDKEIAKELGMAKDTLTRYKKMYGVKHSIRTRKNKSGISERDIQRGMKNGIPRERILKRMIAGFSVERAVTEPLQKWREK
jgi:hypothetical protein